MSSCLGSRAQSHVQIPLAAVARASFPCASLLSSLSLSLSLSTTTTTRDTQLRALMPSSSQKPPSPTPFHTPSTHLLPQPPPPAGAPLKVDHTGFRDDSPSPRSVVGSVRGSAGQGAAGLGDALNRASTPVLDEGEPDGGGEWVTVKAPRKVHRQSRPFSPLSFSAVMEKRRRGLCTERNGRSFLSLATDPCSLLPAPILVPLSRAHS